MNALRQACRHCRQRVTALHNTVYATVVYNIMFIGVRVALHGAQLGTTRTNVLILRHVASCRRSTRACRRRSTQDARRACRRRSTQDARRACRRRSTRDARRAVCRDACGGNRWDSCSTTQRMQSGWRFTMSTVIVWICANATAVIML